jgi:hypothetical protein
MNSTHRFDVSRRRENTRLGLVGGIAPVDVELGKEALPALSR